MVKSCSTNAERAKGRPAEPSDACGPVGASGLFNGKRVSYPRKSTQASGTTAAGVGLSRLEGRSPTDEGVACLTSTQARDEGDVGLLGGPQATADSSVHPKEQEEMIAECLLRPSMLVRAMNAMGFGEVISERQLRRHRNRAGDMICRGRKVDLFAYAAWLTHCRETERMKIGREGAINPRGILRLLEHQQFRCALSIWPCTHARDRST